MARNIFLATATVALCAACIVPAAADDRVSASFRGSILIYPKIEIRWNHAGDTLIQDTFLDLTNDYNAPVMVHLFYINGDPPAPGGPGDCGDAHGGCLDVRVGSLFELRRNAAISWSALTGAGDSTGVGANFTETDFGSPPGRCDPEQDPATAERVLRGWAIVVAMDANDQPIRWNHLKGDALIVNYQDGSAWEYNAYAFMANEDNTAHNAIVNEDGDLDTLNLDGAEYDYVYDKLLLNFYASGAELQGGLMTFDVDVTLFAVSVDLRQDTQGPTCTKAKYDVWNMNEVKFSGAEVCLCPCGWDQRFLSNYPTPVHFNVGNLQTDVGKARIDGMGSTVCPDSVDAALLGLAAKYIEIDNASGPDGTVVAGSNLWGMGTESATILYDSGVGGDDEGKAPPDSTGTTQPPQGGQPGGVNP